MQQWIIIAEIALLLSVIRVHIKKSFTSGKISFHFCNKTFLCKRLQILQYRSQLKWFFPSTVSLVFTYVNYLLYSEQVDQLYESLCLRLWLANANYQKSMGQDDSIELETAQIGPMVVE